MSKPIKKGCKAIIVNSDAGNNGIIINVIEKVGHIGGFDSSMGDRWSVDVEVKTTSGNTCNHMGEKQLRRIDDYDGHEKIEWEEIEDIWSPERVSVVG